MTKIKTPDIIWAFPTGMEGRVGSYDDVACESVCTSYTRTDILEAKDKQIEKLVEALEALVSYAERQTCEHEDTFRGGVLWEICSACGAKWADDDGGRPEYATPKELRIAYEALEVKHKA